ncbi:MAG: hypothetical protein AB7G80_09550 [Dongiaceae bacterium]
MNNSLSTAPHTGAVPTLEEIERFSQFLLAAHLITPSNAGNITTLWYYFHLFSLWASSPTMEHFNAAAKDVLPSHSWLSADAIISFHRKLNFKICAQWELCELPCDYESIGKFLRLLIAEPLPLNKETMQSRLQTIRDSLTGDGQAGTSSPAAKSNLLAEPPLVKAALSADQPIRAVPPPPPQPKRRLPSKQEELALLPPLEGLSPLQLTREAMDRAYRLTKFHHTQFDLKTNISLAAMLVIIAYNNNRHFTDHEGLAGQLQELGRIAPLSSHLSADHLRMETSYWHAIFFPAKSRQISEGHILSGLGEQLTRIFGSKSLHELPWDDFMDGIAEVLETTIPHKRPKSMGKITSPPPPKPAPIKEMEKEGFPATVENDPAFSTAPLDAKAPAVKSAGLNGATALIAKQRRLTRLAASLREACRRK